MFSTLAIAVAVAACRVSIGVQTMVSVAGKEDAADLRVQILSSENGKPAARELQRQNATRRVLEDAAPATVAPTGSAAAPIAAASTPLGDAVAAATAMPSTATATQATPATPAAPVAPSTAATPATPAGQVAAPNATLTAVQASQLQAARACGARANTSFDHVLVAARMVNTSGFLFLDTVQAALETSQGALLRLRGSVAGMLKLAGVDDSFLGDFVDDMVARTSDTYLVLNESTSDFKASLSSIIGQYRDDREKINESLTAAIASTREGLLASATSTRVARTASGSAFFLVQLDALNPKKTATKAIEKVNATSAEVTTMLSSLNTTLTGALWNSVLTKVQTSVAELQAAVKKGEENFPVYVPPSITGQVDAVFKAVFSAIDAVNVSEVHGQITPQIQVAASEIALLDPCLRPLGALVADMDGAWHTASSLSMLPFVIAFIVSRAAM